MGKDGIYGESGFSIRKKRGPNLNDGQEFTLQVHRAIKLTAYAGGHPNLLERRLATYIVTWNVYPNSPSQMSVKV